MKVDLFTSSIDLQDIVLSGYPGEIFEEQVNVDNSDVYNGCLYCFYDLEYKELAEFLKKYKKYGYEIRDSSSGNFIEVHEPDSSRFGFSLN